MGIYRDRMEEELRLRGYAEPTRKAYLAQVKRFVAHYMRSPVELGEEEIRAYLLHMTQKEELATATINQALYALRFFYLHVLGREWTLKFKTQRKRQRKLREALTRDEVMRLLRSATNPKHRLLIMVLYSAGLRLSEAVHLQLSDVDRVGRRIKVRRAKGAPSPISVSEPEGLDTATNDGAFRGGVPASIPPSRPPQGVPSDPLLRPTCQPQPSQAMDTARKELGDPGPAQDESEDPWDERCQALEGQGPPPLPQVPT